MNKIVGIGSVLMSAIALAAFNFLSRASGKLPANNRRSPPANSAPPRQIRDSGISEDRRRARGGAAEVHVEAGRRAVAGLGAEVALGAGQEAAAGRQHSMICQ